MKKYLLYILFIFSLIAYSQEKTDRLKYFEYVIINPKIYSNITFEKKYSSEMILSHLHNSFTNNNFIVLDQEVSKWPKEINQCNVLECYIVYTEYSKGRGKIELALKNCKNINIYINSSKGKASNTIELIENNINPILKDINSVNIVEFDDIYAKPEDKYQSSLKYREHKEQIFKTDEHNLNSYKYIYVPTLKYKNLQNDIWGLSHYARNYLKSNSNFIILDDNTLLSTKDARENPCLVLTLNIDTDKRKKITALGTNYYSIANIKITNCNLKLLLQEKAEDYGDDDYLSALKKIFEKVDLSLYSFQEGKKLDFNRKISEQTNLNEEQIKEYLFNNYTNNIEGIYKAYVNSQFETYYKFGIIQHENKYKAIIIESEYGNWKPGEVKAYIEPTAMNDIYSIRWYLLRKDSLDTYATLDKGALLSIEYFNNIKQEKDYFRFIKLYPQNSDIDEIASSEYKSSGSGFAITNNGIIATNSHVVKGANIIELTFSNKEGGTIKYKADILLNDRANDIALLKIKDNSFSGFDNLPYKLNSNTQVGEKIFTIGFPLNAIMGNNYKVTDGIISSNTGAKDDVRYIQITAPIQPGNSGSPLFNKNGEIVGINTSGLVSTITQNVNYAIKISYLQNMISLLHEAYGICSSNDLKGKELTEQVNVLKNYVCLIGIK